MAHRWMKSSFTQRELTSWDKTDYAVWFGSRVAVFAAFWWLGWDRPLWVGVGFVIAEVLWLGTLERLRATRRQVVICDEYIAWLEAELRRQRDRHVAVGSTRAS